MVPYYDRSWVKGRTPGRRVTHRAQCSSLSASFGLPFLPMPRYERYVALGDSTVEGLDDPHAEGGYRGWADRLAEHLAARQGGLLYANLGIRGRTTAQVRREQLSPALAMSPDLAVLVCGTNDLLARQFDADRLRKDMEAMHSSLVDAGATVLTFTLPDLSPVMPLGRLMRRRLASMNQAIRDAAAASGSIVCDFAHYPVASDPRLWSEDRLHANSLGHQRMAAALADHLGIGTGSSWADPLPGIPSRGLGDLVSTEARWIRRYLLPWLWRHAHGRSSGDGITAKRPDLEPFQLNPNG